MNKIKLLCFLTWVIMSHIAVSQEDSTGVSSQKEFSDYFVDLSVPDLAISGLMDVSSENVLKPSNFTEVAWQVYNDLENMSGIGYGIELPLVRKSKRNLSYYQSHTGRMNTRFSAGVRNSEEGFSLALGMKFNFYNHADPYSNSNYTNRIQKIILDELESSTPEAENYTKALRPINRKLFDTQYYDVVISQYGPWAKKKVLVICEMDELWEKVKDSGLLKSELGALHEAFNRKVSAEDELAIKRNDRLKVLKDSISSTTWNNGFMTMTNGVLLNAADARISSITPKKWQSVLAWGQPILGEFSQLVLNAQFTGNIGGSTLASDAGSDPDLDQRNKLFLGGRWLMKTNKAGQLVTGNIFVEGGYTETSFYSRDLEKVFVGLVGAEFRVMERFWVQGGVGVTNDEGKFQFSLKQNIGEKSRF